MLSFLVPAFLFGGLLLAVPWLVHHIRRPEREPERFSSLMFVPNIKKEVIERRRLQHILLMLLRMLLLLLLAFAFSRPFKSSREIVTTEHEAPTHHMIVLDTSYSMGYAGSVEALRRKAHDVLDSIPSQADVAMVSFSRAPSLLSDFTDAAQTSRQAARVAIDAVELTLNGTNYLTALQFCESQLLARIDDMDDREEPCVLHLISDFRRNGLPPNHQGWRLSGRIRFHGYQLSGTPTNNRSLVEVGVRELDERSLMITGKVKNWSNKAVNAEVKLFVGDQEPRLETVRVAAGNATLVSFPLGKPAVMPLAGRLELESDDLAVDNSRYFLWKLPPHKRLLVVADGPQDEKYNASWFLTRALEADQGPWQVTTTTQTDLANYLDGSFEPDAVLACDLRSIDQLKAQLMRDYVSNGGKLLVCLNQHMNITDLNTHLLNPLGLRALGLRFDGFREDRFENLAWVNFDHPTFFAFRDARFNDFTPLRFTNYHQIEPAGESPAAGITHLARFSQAGDDSLPPAMLEAELGSGKLLIWTFSPELDWTNLPKHIKYVPMINETVKYLSNFSDRVRRYEVGGLYHTRDLSREAGQNLRLPNGEVISLEAEAKHRQLHLGQMGFLEARSDEQDPWIAQEAVNIPASEADPSVLGPDEFSLKLTSNSVTAEDTNGPSTFSGDRERRSEFGRIFLWALALFLILETWYAVYLTPRRKTPV